MRTHDVIVVGGGPAGAAAAERLIRAGADVLVLDRERFPRLKLCAGWITPDVVRDLEFDPDAYPHRFLTFQRVHVHLKGLHLRVPCTQHSIRRWEFDAWLVERSGAPVEQHYVRTIRRIDADYLIDDRFRCRFLIGAGGTSCPVYRNFFREVNPRLRQLQMATFEHEIEYDWSDPDCHLWFFEGGLPGYAWYVPKENGWLNVGLGGAASRMRNPGLDIKRHWAHLTEMLGQGYAPGARYDPSGHSYYLRGPVRVARLDNAFLCGDAAGLATRDLGEGIGPAIRSGQRAADSILHGTPYVLEDVTGTSIRTGLASRLLDWAFTRGAGR